MAVTWWMPRSRFSTGPSCCQHFPMPAVTATWPLLQYVLPRYAAIDIGSNSIRMEAAEVVPGQPVRILASDREVTRLGESVFRNGAVSEEAIDASCAVLARMAEGYRKL